MAFGREGKLGHRATDLVDATWEGMDTILRFPTQAVAFISNLRR